MDRSLTRFRAGTDEAFTLARYKDFLGKAYLKVALFICEEDDYIASKQKLLQ